jgi:hypothetical protein
LESAGKTVNVVCPDPMTVEFNRLVGVESVADVFGSRNLVISFPDQTENVDKVSYNLEKGELQLVITPKPDAPDLDYKKLKFVAGTAKSDLIIFLDVSDLSDLGVINDEAREQFQTTTLISISRNPNHENYSLHQFNDPSASSLCEVVTHLADALRLNIKGDAASNLLLGLEKATNNFRSATVAADTFAAAAILMNSDARRHEEISASDFPPGAIPAQVIPPTAPVQPPPPPPPPPRRPQSSQPSQQLGYGTDSSDSDGLDEKKAKNPEKRQPPADWYEPKIYKGPMLQ